MSDLIICGADDKICSRDLPKEIADNIIGARRRTLERCGHFVLYEQATKLAEELRRWLNLESCLFDSA